MIELGKRIAASVLFVAALAGSMGAARADVQWVQLKVEGYEPVRAALGVVAGARGPAVIFNHGTGVRHFGHDESVSRGDMDVTDYVKALNAMGYTAIAPVRTILKDSAYYERGGTVGSSEECVKVITYGMAAVKGARDFLAAHPKVDPARIAVMGFSEGGNVTLWSAIRQRGFKAVVLLAPATLRDAKRYSLMRAVREKNLASVNAPVFLAVGADDMPPIRKVTRDRLIPTLESLGKTIVHRTDYPGGHEWFYKPADVLLKDVGAFLAQHLR